MAESIGQVCSQGGAQAKSPAPATGRILADMEGRSVASPARAAQITGNGKRRAWLLLGLVGSVVVIGGLLAWGLSSDESGSSTVDAYSLAPDIGTANPAAAAAAPPAAAGAMIVDAPADPAADPPTPVDAPSGAATDTAAPVAAAATAPSPHAGTQAKRPRRPREMQAARHRVMKTCLAP